ncbi:MAG: MaoC/PaaZ C-terminal domain-containing protein [SAR202 cluster bacterium]|nr:MaoC/PaaZ C-terminal domain-containing protein [SAR202 cluster bacterium]MDP7225581.1 MaoC/PaaZ C-terminal domain-containing protein [SAR202 cluster bacterium]MDP7413304.1 MaoC/PaaZ C-terminal domain-containing protein [SAR202 cluster bacterium]
MGRSVALGRERRPDREPGVDRHVGHRAFVRRTDRRLQSTHFDEAFANGTRFKGLIAQGGIATGLLHALVAMDLPGPGSVFMRQNWSFPKPVYIGDTIKATGAIMTFNQRRSIATMEFRVIDQNGQDVLTGEATVMQLQSTAQT